MPPKLKTTKGGVSIPHDTRRDGKARARELGLTFSAYIALLIQNDVRAPDKPLVIHIPKRLTPPAAPPRRRP